MLFALQQGGFGRFGRAPSEYPVFVSADYALPGTTTTAYHTIAQVTLRAGGVYLIQYAIEFIAQLGTAAYVVRHNCAADNAGGCAYGHDHIAANALGFNGEAVALCYAAIADGSPVAFEVNSSSTSGRRASNVGTLIVDAGGADTTYQLQLKDHTTAQTGRVGVVVRKIN